MILDDIVGVWITGGKEPAKIQVYKNGEKYFGKITWLQNPLSKEGKPRTDKNNPDKNKKSTPVIGLVILKGFKFDGHSEWRNGEIYDPESGNSYTSYLYLKNRNTLRVRGYIGLSLFGRTETWTRSH